LQYILYYEKHNYEIVIHTSYNTYYENASETLCNAVHCVYNVTNMKGDTSCKNLYDFPIRLYDDII